MNYDKNQYKELWVEAKDEQVMYALINGSVGWLMYLRENGDSGFHSINPNYHGEPGEQLKFYLNNGQMDEYPMEWVLPVQEVYKALDYFEKEKKPPLFISWKSDYGEELIL